MILVTNHRGKSYALHNGKRYTLAKKRHEFISWLHITVRLVFLILPIENLLYVIIKKKHQGEAMNKNQNIAMRISLAVVAVMVDLGRDLRGKRK